MTTLASAMLLHPAGMPHISSHAVGSAHAISSAAEKVMAGRTYRMHIPCTLYRNIVLRTSAYFVSSPDTIPSVGRPWSALQTSVGNIGRAQNARVIGPH